MNALNTTLDPLTEALQSSAIIVTLTISAWSPNRVDRKLSQDVADARSSEERAFSVKKNLFHGADTHLKTISSVQTDFRRYHYQMTLPFGTSNGPNDRGPRLLSNDAFMPYCQRLAQAVAAMQEALTALTAGYAASVETARQRLGDAFNPSDYPDAAYLPHLFAISADFNPVPDKNGFRGLPGATLDRLSSYMEKKVQKQAAAATGALSERVAAYLKRLSDRLTALDETLGVEGARKAAIRESLFTEAASLADLIAGFPFASDEKMQDAIALLNEVRALDATAIEDTDTRGYLMAKAANVYSCFDEV